MLAACLIEYVSVLICGFISVLVCVRRWWSVQEAEGIH